MFVWYDADVSARPLLASATQPTAAKPRAVDVAAGLDVVEDTVVDREVVAVLDAAEEVGAALVDAGGFAW